MIAPSNSYRVGVLVSGRGTNLQAIIDAIEEGRLSARIAVVISNVADAYALERARRHGIPALFVDPAPYKGRREDYDRELVRILKEYRVELVCMAGFMRILTPYFINSFSNRILNIHPALLPAFPGLKAQKAALDYGVKFSGCTVHIADEGVDTGPVVIQAVVPVLPDDTEESLEERILREEHKIYPQAIQWFAEGRVVVEGRRVAIKDSATPQYPTLFNPPLEMK